MDAAGRGVHPRRALVIEHVPPSRRHGRSGRIVPLVRSWAAGPPAP